MNQGIPHKTINSASRTMQKTATDNFTSLDIKRLLIFLVSYRDNHHQKPLNVGYLELSILPL